MEKRIEAKKARTLGELAEDNKIADWIMTQALNRPGWDQDLYLLKEMVLPESPFSERDLEAAVQDYMKEIEDANS
jgi:hypothetical protein